MTIVSKFPADWWKTAVFYQIYPRSFYDSNNDGIGDLKGITQKLDYLNDGNGGGLGIDAIWLSPFFPSPMKDFGYDVSDYCEIDPMFGVMADFEELVHEAHTRDIKIVIDLVLNHTSDQHPWFQESRKDRTNPKADWFVWHDPKPDGSVPNNWVSVFGGPGWTYDENRKQYYYHAFLKEQPDLNWYNPEVQAAVKDVIHFWAKKGVDGFRLDTANFYAHDLEFRDNPKQPEGSVPLEMREGVEYDKYITCFSKDRPENFEFLKFIRQSLEEISPHLTTVGEIGGIQQIDELIDLSCRYVQGNERLHMVYNFCLLGALTTSKIIEVLQKTEAKREDGHMSWSLGNHDCPRVITRTQGNSINPGFHQTLILMLLSIKGTPILYYGDEVDLPDYDIQKDEVRDPVGIHYWPQYKGRDGCRTPFPWDMDQPNQGFNQGTKPWLPTKSPVDLKQQFSDPLGTLSVIKEMIRIRKSSPALQFGSFQILFRNDHGFLFERKTETQTVQVACNVSNSEMSIDLDSDQWTPMTINAFNNNGTLSGTVLTLPAFGFSILQRDQN